MPCTSGMAGLYFATLPGRPIGRYLPSRDAEALHGFEWNFTMNDSKNDFRKALSAIVDVRSREAARQIGYRRQHQLIGALTKRP